ncbi:hypothetical protein CDAR_3061 [Caerostris darwini]|uniref:Uncharacterized protein n=1 Tax=Caerostris darwini TaxID=1538125 RepID=A0AAV4UVU5_9ARAC|nr:hypothetical protein CDAR_3061 [Caerostris darwini]
MVFNNVSCDNTRFFSHRFVWLCVLHVDDHRYGMQSDSLGAVFGDGFGAEWLQLRLLRRGPCGHGAEIRRLEFIYFFKFKNAFRIAMRAEERLSKRATRN